MGLFDWLGDEEEEEALRFDDAIPIDAASEGNIVIAGRVRELDAPASAPSDGAPCVWYVAEAESLPLDALAQPTRGMRLSRRVGVRCLLQDESGLAVVDLAGARFRGRAESYALTELGESAHVWVGDLREEAGHPRMSVDAVALHEARVSIGDEIVVEGEASWSTDVPVGAGAVSSGYRSSPRLLVVSDVRRGTVRERGPD